MTPKQTAFVAEYMIDLNASAAARRAGYRGDANTVGPRLLADVGVQAAIAAAQQKRAERTQIDADWVLKRLAALADADLSDVYDESGNLRPIAEWPEAWRKGLVAGVDTVQERDGSDAEGRPVYSTVRKVKLMDRAKLFELIGKHVNVGAFRERIEVEDITDRAEQMRQRRAQRLGNA